MCFSFRAAYFAVAHCRYTYRISSGKKSAQGREFKVYKEREGIKGRKRWKGKKGEKGREKGEKGRKTGKKRMERKRGEKGSKKLVKNYACDTHLKFTKGKRNQLKIVFGKRLW